MTDMRCRDCIDIGCECPKGYLAATMICQDCDYTFVLNAAMCMVDKVTCPECYGAIEEA